MAFMILKAVGNGVELQPADGRADTVMVNKTFDAADLGPDIDIDTMYAVDGWCAMIVGYDFDGVAVADALFMYADTMTSTWHIKGAVAGTSGMAAKVYVLFVNHAMCVDL